MKTKQDTTLIKKLLDYAQKFIAHPRHLGRVYMTSDAQTIKFQSKTTDGTTTEEMLEILIHRLRVLQGEQPCAENITAIEGLLYAGNALKLRANNEFVNWRLQCGVMPPQSYFTRRTGG